MPVMAINQRAQAYFEDLRDRICAALERLDGATFERTRWDRQGGGGGEMALMRGGVFEKVGVNVSAVRGTLPERLRAQVPGAGSGAFRACGISLVAHPRSPMVPAVHLNLRRIETTAGWFGGGTDLTPYEPFAEDTALFHQRLKACCDRHDATYHPRFSAWCDEYFFLRHRNEPRGAGGIFFDNLDSGDVEADFAFVRDVGETFLATYPEIVSGRKELPFTPAQRDAQLVRRGRYVEFNLLYDRGTTFGLETGGNVEAILMSLPPEVRWP
ncbi:MAG: oxygen-dependent coproporphyrinogen oxidase [Nitrospirae bacterium]|nr:oxygen-dependent coproporphyrinogen oxidase [Nitrospirota bacterium]